MTDASALPPSSHYADLRGRITSLVGGLDAAALATRVPGCPEWDVRELVSHLAALPDDLLDGKADDAGSDGWTARQVQERQGVGVPDLIQEWAQGGDRLAPQLDGWGYGGWRPVYDAAIHEDDIREALGLAPAQGPAHQALLDGLVWGAGRRLAKADLPALTVITDTEHLPVGAGDPALTVQGGTVEIRRALSGRRSLAAMRQLDWSGDPEPYLPVLPAFPPRA